MRDRVLFVDQDERVLEQIRQKLDHMAEEWEMVFSEGGENAIGLLREKSFSVIVSDVDNRNEDGIHLLDHVKAEFPNVARVIFSSDLDAAQLHHAADDKHFYLRKGCDLSEFEVAIQHAVSMHSSLLEHPRPLSNEELTEVLVGYFKKQILFRKMTVSDVPKRIRPYLSRALLDSAL